MAGASVVSVCGGGGGSSGGLGIVGNSRWFLLVVHVEMLAAMVDLAAIFIGFVSGRVDSGGNVGGDSRMERMFAIGDCVDEGGM